mgnify:CR=1 FL=1
MNNSISSITNNNKDLTSFNSYLASLYSYLSHKLGIKTSPKLKLVNSNANSKNPFGFTGHYNPDTKEIALYITNRHNTDILRSFAHEIIHHWQNERGTLNNNTNSTNTAYAQTDSWLRKREYEAYLFGNILFRDWQDEQRYGVPEKSPTLPKPLDENLKLFKKNPELYGAVLKNKVQNFVRDLIINKLIISYHNPLSSGDMQAKDFEDDLTHKILSAIEQWTNNVNNKSNKDSQPLTTNTNTNTNNI